ncbi:MAG: FHA domain-containing protein [SAR324 cluster bacterium]|nr:FHA domain-containing protein [SAR324 cluster bacterium]
MIRIMTVFRVNYYPYVLLLPICCIIYLYFWADTAKANDWQIQITGTDSHLAYIGGNRYIFLSIVDAEGNHAENLTTDNISFQVDGQPHLFSEFTYQYQRVNQKLSLLIGLEDIAESSMRDKIKNGFAPLILQKKTSDKIFVAFNDSNRPNASINNIQDLEKALNPPSNAGSRALSDEFLLKYVQSAHEPGKRQWIIFIASAAEDTLEDQTAKEKLAALLMDYQITLIPIVVGKPSFDHWLFALATATGGKAYPLSSLNVLPARLQGIMKKIQQEYVLEYQLNILGDVSHDVEIKLVSDKGVQQVNHRVEQRPIWPMSPPNLLVSFIFSGGVFFAGWYLFQKKAKETAVLKDQTGFQIMTLGEDFQFIPLDQKSYFLDFLSTVKTKGNLRLSANLGKVTLTQEQGSYFLEDKNYKNALLINRRRVRRTLLRSGDILDIGELTLIYLHKTISSTPEIDDAEKNKILIYSDKPLGPIRKKIGVLIDERKRQEYHLVKNITFIGRSKTNNIILDNGEIAPRHAKIIRVGNQYKLQSLSTQEGSFVNRRRVEQRFLRDGDELSFDTCRLRFRIVQNHPSRTHGSSKNYNSSSRGERNKSTNGQHA